MSEYKSLINEEVARLLMAKCALTNKQFEDMFTKYITANSTTLLYSQQEEDNNEINTRE